MGELAGLHFHRAMLQSDQKELKLALAILEAVDATELQSDQEELKWW